MRPVRNLSSTTIVYLVLLLAVIAGAVLTAMNGRNFFSTGNLRDILTATSVLGFFAIGQTLVVLAGSLDLSVPFVGSLASLVGAVTMAGVTGNIVLGVLLALAISAAIGLVNGLIVAFWGVHGFIATLGMGLILSGYLGTNYPGPTSRLAPTAFELLGRSYIGPLPVSTLIMLGLAGLIILVLRQSTIGLHLYAVGGNREIARLSGIRVQPPIIFAHTMCSLLAGMAGLLYLSRTGGGSPTFAEQAGYDLLSIAAVVLGGTLLAGGKGKLLGTIGGVAIFAVMNNVMAVMDVNSFLRDVFRGAVIILAVAVYARRSITSRPPRFVSGKADTTPGAPDSVRTVDAQAQETR